MPPKKAAPKKAPAKKPAGKKGTAAAPEPQLGRGKREKKPVQRLGVDDDWGLTGEYLEVKKASFSDEESNKSEPKPEEEPDEEEPKPAPKKRAPRKKRNVPNVVDDPDTAMQDPDPVNDFRKQGKGKRRIEDVDDPEEAADPKLSKSGGEKTSGKPSSPDVHPRQRSFHTDQYSWESGVPRSSRSMSNTCH